MSPRIAYEDWTPNPTAEAMLDTADRIATSYAAQGYNLTLRQLYYRFVATDAFPDDRRWTWTGSRWARDPNGTKNADPNYKWLGGLVNKGRLAGLLDWDHFEDRTRNLEEPSTWVRPQAIMAAARDSYREDTWATQPTRVEVWVEKDALEDVVGRAADAWDCAHFSCRGYVSQSEMWAAAQRINDRWVEHHGRPMHQPTIILHLGDHDPSGIDMTRDIRDRLYTFTDPGCAPEVDRIALNRLQVAAFNPPPSPAKITDSRAAGYIAEHGTDSWELDALEPQELDALVREHIADEVDMDLFEEARARQEENRGKITEAIRNMEGLK